MRLARLGHISFGMADGDRANAFQDAASIPPDGHRLEAVHQERG